MKLTIVAYFLKAQLTRQMSIRPAPPPPRTAHELSDDDVALLGIQSPEDAQVICIATYHPNETVTVNLKGPIIFNQQTGKARQIVPLNAAELSLSHPMGN